MEPAAFVVELERMQREHLQNIDAMRDETCALKDKGEMIRRLKLALRQELEAAEIAALWLPTTPQLDIKLALGKLCGDETKHYRLIVRRLAELGHDVSAYNPLVDGHTKLYDYLASLSEPIERIAAANFTRESIGYTRNEQFIQYCLDSGDTETARMYREDIQPDEGAHARTGRDLLESYALTEDIQARARAAAEKTLIMAEGAVQALISAQKMSHAPGC